MKPLTDRYGRKIDYLRISVTDRCNLRCFYCMPEAGAVSIRHDAVLRYEEILSIVETSRSLGFARFRITGGEPLVRRGIIWFLEELSEKGVNYSLTTNGLLLGRYARDLARAGLGRVNVGLDTLDRERFRRITLHDGLRAVLRGIEEARNSGIGAVKINVVVMRGINDDEVETFLAWARRERLDIRFIEFMPVYGEDMFVSLKPAIDAFRRRGDIEPAQDAGGGPAKSFSYRDGSGTVGFILPRSEPFCGCCNRLRLTADGMLLPCLFSKEGIDLRGPLRRGEGIAGIIEHAVSAKPREHELKMRLRRYRMNALGG